MAKDDFETEEDIDALEAQERAEAEAKETAARLEVLDMKRALEHDYVQRVLWRIVTDCAVFRSIWDPSSKIHYNAAKQEVGQDILRKMSEADLHFVARMMSQEYSRKLKESTR